MYFVQGILGLSRLGVTFLYKDEFGLDPASVRPSSSSSKFPFFDLCINYVRYISSWHAVAQVAFLTSFAAFPWVVKPLYGFLSDTVPIYGYRRRSYLIICGILGAPLDRLAHSCVCIDVHPKNIPAAGLPFSPRHAIQCGHGDGRTVGMLQCDDGEQLTLAWHASEPVLAHAQGRRRGWRWRLRCTRRARRWRRR